MTSRPADLQEQLLAQNERINALERELEALKHPPPAPDPTLTQRLDRIEALLGFSPLAPQETDHDQPQP